jgi:ABC-type polysaccharide/polyol phosphate export permease
MLYSLPFITGIILVMVSYIAVRSFRNKAMGNQKADYPSWLYAILIILLLVFVAFEFWSVIKLK